MFGDLTRALGELRHRAFWGVALGAICLTLLLLVGLFWLGGWLLGVGGDITATLPWLGETEAPGFIGVILYVLAALGLSLFLTGPVAALFIGLFMEVIISAVEKRSYAAAGPGKPAPMLDQIRAAVLLFLAVLAGNALVLLISLLFPPAAPFLLIAVNGWLLGREYVEAVALRRMPEADAKAFRRQHRGRVFGVGAAMAALMAIPLVNLAAPLLGAAAATHLFHRVRREAG
jgi:uncharacterized protein involved in cysteine biosynthesis